MSTETLSLIIAALAVIVGPFVAYSLGARSALAQGTLELGRMKTVMKERTHGKHGSSARSSMATKPHT